MNNNQNYIPVENPSGSYPQIQDGYSVPVEAPQQQYVQQPVFFNGQLPYAVVPPGGQSSEKKSTLPKAAKIALWAVGGILGLTIIFGCITAWVVGMRLLGGGNTTTTSPSADSGSYSQQDPEFNFSVPNIPGFDFGNSINGGNGSTTGGSINDVTPGFGMTVVAIDIDFKIEDKYDAGLVIAKVQEEGAFKGLDVRENDLIVEADGHIVETIDDLDAQLAGKKVGDEMTLKLARYENGVASTFDVTVNLVDISVFAN